VPLHVRGHPILETFAMSPLKFRLRYSEPMIGPL